MNTRSCLLLASAVTLLNAACSGPSAEMREAEEACDSGQASACVRAAELYELEPDDERPDATQSLYQAACDLDDRAACFELALLLDPAPSADSDAQVLSLLAFSCPEYPAACNALGEITSADGQAPDVVAGWYRWACGQGDAYGCGQLGLLQFDGLVDVDDWGIVRRRIEDGCDVGLGDACGAAGVMALEVREQSAEGIEYALEWFSLGCELNSFDSCFALAVMHETGSGVEQSDFRATQLYEASCGDGAGNLVACTNLGLMVASEPQGVGRGRELHGFACDGGEPKGCTNLALLLLNSAPEESALAVTLLSSACQAEEPVACSTLGSLYVAGDLLGQNIELAAGLFRNACEADEPVACYNLALLYQSGQGVEQDDIFAQRLFEFSCALGYEPACPELVN